MAAAIRHGDVVLVDELGQGLVSASIALGAMLRRGWGSPDARWTHVAIVYDAPSQDPSAITIVEARASATVRKAFLAKYRKRYAVVHTGVRADDWVEVKKFLDSVLAARERYDILAYAWLTVYALTGTRVCLQRAGTATCSGLVADALTRRGFVWTRPPYAMTPAEIAADLKRFKCPATSFLAAGARSPIRRRLGQCAGAMAAVPRG